MFELSRYSLGLACLLIGMAANATPRLELRDIPPLRVLPNEPNVLMLELVNQGNSPSFAGRMEMQDVGELYRFEPIDGPCGPWVLSSAARRTIDIPALAVGQSVRCDYRVEEVASNRSDTTLVLRAPELSTFVQYVPIGRFVDIKTTLMLMDVTQVNGELHRRYRAQFENLSDEHIVQARFSQCSLAHNVQTANGQNYVPLRFASISCPRSPGLNDCETIGVSPPAIFSTQIPTIPPRGSSNCELITINQTPTQTLRGFQIERDFRSAARGFVDPNPFDNVFTEAAIANIIPVPVVHGPMRWVLAIACLALGFCVLARRSH